MLKETEAFELVFVNDHPKHQSMMKFLDEVEKCMTEMNASYEENDIDQHIYIEDVHFNVILQHQLSERKLQRSQA